MVFHSILWETYNLIKLFNFLWLPSGWTKVQRPGLFENINQCSASASNSYDIVVKIVLVFDSC